MDNKYLKYKFLYLQKKYPDSFKGGATKVFTTNFNNDLWIDFNLYKTNISAAAKLSNHNNMIVKFNFTKDDKLHVIIALYRKGDNTIFWDLTKTVNTVPINLDFTEISRIVNVIKTPPSPPSAFNNIIQLELSQGSNGGLSAKFNSLNLINGSIKYLYFKDTDGDNIGNVHKRFSKAINNPTLAYRISEETVSDSRYIVVDKPLPHTKAEGIVKQQKESAEIALREIREAKIKQLKLRGKQRQNRVTAAEAAAERERLEAEENAKLAAGQEAVAQLTEAKQEELASLDYCLELDLDDDLPKECEDLMKESSK